jgi:tetratricopeptide (TPR) repeat protein
MFAGRGIRRRVPRFPGFSESAGRGSLWRMYTRTKALGSVLVLVALGGCNALTDQQRAMLLEGERAFRDKHYEHAAQTMSAFLGAVNNRPETARALYTRGMARALLGQRAWAYADLQRAAQEAGDPELTWQPHAALGILYFEDDNWSAAAQALAGAVERMPSVAPKDALLFRLGMCHERTGHWSAAQGPFRRIVGEFPQGTYAATAERRLQLNADHFAVQCGVFSRMENANQLLERLKQHGLRPQVRPEERKGTSCYVVLEGRYGSYQEANQALSRVRTYVPDAVLWP